MELIDILILLPLGYLIIELLRQRSVAQSGGLKGPFQFFPPFNPILHLVPRKLFGWDLFKYRSSWAWDNTYHDLYGKWGDFMAIHTFKGPIILISDPDMVKEMTSNRLLYPKPVDTYKVVDIYGKNVVSTEFDEWKLHRKLAAPGFTERNNKLVHEQTLLLCLEMFKDWDSKADQNTGTLTADVKNDFTKLALYVISAAGFGVNLDWKTSEETPVGHDLPFHKAIEIMSTNTIPKLILPQWVFDYVPIKRLKEIDLGFKEFEKYILEVIDKAKASIANNEEETADLVFSLVQAEAEGNTLTFRELVGNTFILLFAGKYHTHGTFFLISGHETTAHTLMFTFGLLALHQNIQEELYVNIWNVLGDRLANYEDFTALEHSFAVFQETLRLYPPAIAIPKITGEDLELGGVKLKKNMMLNIHIAALARHPLYWDEPDEFRPWRFLKENSSKINWKAFIPFSDGARSCLGKRFAQIEAVCIITTIIQRYKIGLAYESDKEILLECAPILTLTPKRPVNLTFTPRR